MTVGKTRDLTGTGCFVSSRRLVDISVVGPAPRWYKVVGKASGLLAGVFLAGYLIITLFPIFWIVTASLKSPSDNLTLPPVLLFWPTFQAYERVLFQEQFYRSFFNSTIVAVSTTLIALVLGSMTSYWLIRYPFRFGRVLEHWLLSTRMIFPMVYAIPLFLLFYHLGILNSLFTLITAYTTFSIPYAVWIMGGFFAAIPREIDEAALVDGCSRLGAFVRIVLPLSGPGLAAAGIFVFILAWNEFLFALILVGGGDAKTLPIVVQQMGRREGMAAVSTATMLPMLIFFGVIQKYLIRGMIAGAVR